MAARRKPVISVEAKSLLAGIAVFAAGLVLVQNPAIIFALLLPFTFPLTWVVIGIAAFIGVSCWGGVGPHETTGSNLRDRMAWLFPLGLIWGVLLALMFFR
jgi:hypothetical protein